MSDELHVTAGTSTTADNAASVVDGTVKTSAAIVPIFSNDEGALYCTPMDAEDGDLVDTDSAIDVHPDAQDDTELKDKEVGDHETGPVDVEHRILTREVFNSRFNDNSSLDLGPIVYRVRKAKTTANGNPPSSRPSPGSGELSPARINGFPTCPACLYEALNGVPQSLVPRRRRAAGYGGFAKHVDITLPAAPLASSFYPYPPNPDAAGMYNYPSLVGQASYLAASIDGFSGMGTYDSAAGYPYGTASNYTGQSVTSDSAYGPQSEASVNAWLSAVDSSGQSGHLSPALSDGYSTAGYSTVDEVYTPESIGASAYSTPQWMLSDRESATENPVAVSKKEGEADDEDADMESIISPMVREQWERDLP